MLSLIWSDGVFLVGVGLGGCLSKVVYKLVGGGVWVFF